MSILRCNVSTHVKSCLMLPLCIKAPFCSYSNIVLRCGKVNISSTKLKLSEDQSVFLNFFATFQTKLSLLFLFKFVDAFLQQQQQQIKTNKICENLSRQGSSLFSFWLVSNPGGFRL